jgi:hypothetical protein
LLGGGRLLVYYPDEELADGAAEEASGGFFDVENVPAWDTWVGLYQDERGEDYLVSWVPPSFREIVGEGIRVNPEECIHWISETDVPLLAYLRSLGVAV